jgi:hypothetical protein
MTDEDQSPPAPHDASDATFQQEVERLHRYTVYTRWAVVGVLWLILAPLCLWGLRDTIALLLDYFTWSAVRYGLIFHRFSAIGLAICIGSTLAVLIWQSRNILFGLSKGERQRLERQVLRIRQQGSSHPLWKFVCHKVD